MGDHAMRLLFSNPSDVQQLPVTNDVMVEELSRTGALRSQCCIDAFKAVDRAHFWIEGSGELVYADMPLRNGRLHLSAPQIYAEALESLMPLKPGMSFLNVGSGTGYFNSIISELIGELSTNHGIEIWSETLDHAKQRRVQHGKESIDYFLGNVYQIDVAKTMRYDRIYLGACANSRSKYLYRLLEVGGTLVGPFQAGRSQQLRRVVRQTENRFSVEVLESVRFASLVEPIPTEPSSVPPVTEEQAESMEGVQSTSSFSGRLSASSRNSSARTPGEEATQVFGLPGVPFTFSINDRPWTPERCYLYPPSYRRVVLMGLLSRPPVQQATSGSEGSTKPSYCLPMDVWTQHIFPWCPRWWFETAETTPSLRLPPLCKEIAENDDSLSDDGGGSTCAPSSRLSSAQATPESTPSMSPPLPPTFEPPEEDFEDLSQLYEVFRNGQSHVIGRGDDPDDTLHDEGPRNVLPLQVLQLLVHAVHNRERDPTDRAATDDEDEQDEDDGMDFPELEPDFHGDSDLDAEMMTAHGEDEDMELDDDDEDPATAIEEEHRDDDNVESTAPLPSLNMHHTQLAFSPPPRRLANEDPDIEHL